MVNKVEYIGYRSIPRRWSKRCTGA